METWQLYDDQGRALAGEGASKNEVFTKGLLHGAAHVWVWRKITGSPEILLQKRATNKRTWPGRFDVSAAGHIALGEEPTAAAIRETEEEIGLDVPEIRLSLTGVEQRNITAPNGDIENEFCWVYILKLEADKDFKLQEDEVESLLWKNLSEFEAEVLDDNQNQYVPQGSIYFHNLISAIVSASTN